MNTNSNTYTVIYSIILVVVVAAVLAFAAKYLQPAQDKNIKEDTICQILTAAGLYDKYEKSGEINILQTYSDNLDSAIVINGKGEWHRRLDSLEVYTTSMLKAQIAAADTVQALPVYIFKNGITVIPCYGAGLWGPVWGYVGLDKDLKTIKGVSFDHKGETPGLGAKIAEEPFSKEFVTKQVGSGEIYFEVTKPANRQTENNGVDAISGATITSKAVGEMLNQWFGFYKNYFETKGIEVVDGVINVTGELEPENAVGSNN